MVEEIVKNSVNFLDVIHPFEDGFERKLQHLSGERWRASAALGYACGKKIFYAPYMGSNFYYQMNRSNLFNVLRFLTDNGAIEFRFS